MKKGSISPPKNSDATLSQYMIYKLLQRAVLNHYRQGVADTVLQEKEHFICGLNCFIKFYNCIFIDFKVVF